MRKPMLVLALLAPLLAGCTGMPGNLGGAFEGCSAHQGSGGQSGVCTTPDHFAYGGQVGGKSGTETYTWRNNGAAARVAWGGQGSGSFTLTLVDAAGQQVFAKAFSGSGQDGASERTREGQPGEWTVRIAFSGFSGQMGLSVRRA